MKYPKPHVLLLVIVFIGLVSIVFITGNVISQTEPCKIHTPDSELILIETKTSPPFLISLYHPKLDQYVSATLLNDRIYPQGDPNELYIQSILNANHGDGFIVDIGSHVGYYSLMAAANGLDVVAFEPVRDSVRKLEQGIEANHFKNVKVVPLAASDTEQQIAMRICSSNRGHAFGHDHKYQSVDIHASKENPCEIIVENTRTTRVDLHVAQSQKITLIKLDCEGFEGRALRGFWKSIVSGNVEHIAMEFNPALIRETGILPESMLSQLLECGYSIRFNTHPDMVFKLPIQEAIASKVANMDSPTVDDVVHGLVSYLDHAEVPWADTMLDLAQAGTNKCKELPRTFES